MCIIKNVILQYVYLTSKIILLIFYTMYLQEERARKAANRKARIAADLDAVESDQVITAFIL